MIIINSISPFYPSIVALILSSNIHGSCTYKWKKDDNGLGVDKKQIKFKNKFFFLNILSQKAEQEEFTLSC